MANTTSGTSTSTTAFTNTLTELKTATAAAAVATNAQKTANLAVQAAGEVLGKAKAALDVARAALEADNNNNPASPEVKAKLDILTNVGASVATLESQVATLDEFTDFGTFLNGKFGFKPGAKLNTNTTITEKERKAALIALKAISNSAKSPSNSTLGGSNLATAPTRKAVLTALSNGVIAIAEQTREKYKSSLTNANRQAAEAAEEAASAEIAAKAAAERAAAAATESTGQKEKLTLNAILAFNKALSELAMSAQTAIESKVNEAGNKMSNARFQSINAVLNKLTPGQPVRGNLQAGVKGLELTAAEFNQFKKMKNAAAGNNSDSRKAMTAKLNQLRNKLVTA